MLPGADVVLVRYGEVGTKSRRVRVEMERQLCDNLRALLADRGVPGEVERRHARPLIHTEEPGAAAAVATDAVGVISASPARRLPPEKRPIEAALAETAEDCYDGGTFAVDARRATDDVPFTSRELEVDGGSAVWRAVEDRFDPAVDLEDPDVRFGVEVRPDGAFLYLETVEGPGGLPLGSQTSLVALVSGGIDSPVAAYEVMRRGSPVHPIYVDLGDYGGPDHRARAMSSVRTLAGYAPGRAMDPWRVPAGSAVARLVEEMDRGRMLSFRRFMFRVAEHLARFNDADGVVTGECLGQKSSQTARNLAVTTTATDLPVHRPLLAWDKTDIEARARALGTFEDATVRAGCNRIVPDHPETDGRLDALRRAEPDDLFDMAEATATAAERVDLAGR